MNMTRWLLAAAIAMLGSMWARADSVPPSDGHYEIELAGWDADQEFEFLPNIPMPSDTNPCLPAGDICNDPSIRLDNGGGSTGESGDFFFNSGSGTETLYFDNLGAPITSVEITTVLNPDEYNESFTCSGGDIFQLCGFIVDPPAGSNTETLDIYFSDPYNPNGIPTATPEPAQWIVLLLGMAGMIVVRARSASASSFVRTQRSVCQTRDS